MGEVRMGIIERRIERILPDIKDIYWMRLNERCEMGPRTR